MAQRRLVVVGTTGAGKSTLAKRLSETLGLNFVELDALYWEPGWRAASVADFRARVVEATAGDDWVVAGNYRQVRDIIWPLADTVVWLDYSLPLLFARLTRRTLRRAITREVLWNGIGRTSGPTSSSGRKSPSTTGCSRPTGNAGGSFRSCSRVPSART